jgi:hypothetical protein
MIRTVVLASTAVLAVSGVAHAEGNPVLIGSGDNAVVDYVDGLPGSVVGGTDVRMSGTADDTSSAYAAVRPVLGRVARPVGSGENAQLIDEPATAPASMIADHRARATGS